MNEEKAYKIDLDSIKTRFIFKKEGGLTHKPGQKMKLLPYTTNGELPITFEGIIGSFSRMICNKELKREFNSDELIENTVDVITEFEGENSKEIFKEILKSVFIDRDKLVNFHIQAINYIPASTGDDKIARFIYSMFFDDELKELVKEYYNRKELNILYKLVLDSLPRLDEKKNSYEGYKCYIPFIKELFIKDFKFLIENEDLYKNSLKRVLEYYYMFYVSQLAIKLSKFEKADLNKPEVVYYTLGWESTSKNRTAYKFGWYNLENYIHSLFSHAIALELLNHNGLEKQLGYTELFNLFIKLDENQVEAELNLLFDAYTSQITDKCWSDFRHKERGSGNRAFDIVYKIFDAIEYQFIKTTRTGPKNKYNNRFIDFVELNFAKRRGSLGYNLNLTEEDIILMTKLCINKNEKLKLNLLFDEFKKRGMSFDRDSKLKIIQLYEKLNLLEKKSDSGDAQYVRSVL